MGAQRETVIRYWKRKHSPEKPHSVLGIKKILDRHFATLRVGCAGETSCVAEEWRSAALNSNGLLFPESPHIFLINFGCVLPEPNWGKVTQPNWVALWSADRSTGQRSRERFRCEKSDFVCDSNWLVCWKWKCSTQLEVEATTFAPKHSWTHRNISCFHPHFLSRVSFYIYLSSSVSFSFSLSLPSLYFSFLSVSLSVSVCLSLFLLLSFFSRSLCVFLSVALPCPAWEKT